MPRALQPAELHLRVMPRRDALEPARRAVVEFLAPWQMSPGALYAVEVVLEEALTNIVTYAFADDRPPAPVELAVGVDDATVCLSITDRGVAFDPLQARPAPPPRGLDDAVPGGRGLLLMRRFATALAYERRDGRNLLTVRIARSA